LIACPYRFPTHKFTHKAKAVRRLIDLRVVAGKARPPQIMVNLPDLPGLVCFTNDPLSGTYTLQWERRMIVSFRDEWLRAFFVDNVRTRNIPSDLESRLFRKLQMMDDATTDRDLRVAPSNHFEKLRGNLEGLHSIRVNKQWRLIFHWDGGRGEAAGVYLDNHSYQ